MSEDQCIICEGQFDPLKLKEGKCSICQEEFPNAKNRQEALEQTGPQKGQVTNLTEDKVRNIVREEIAQAMKAVCDVKKSESDKGLKARMAKARDARESKKQEAK